MKIIEYDQTSEVWPCRTVTSLFGISQGKEAKLVQISIGSAPSVQMNTWHKLYIMKNHKEGQDVAH